MFFSAPHKRTQVYVLRALRGLPLVLDFQSANTYLATHGDANVASDGQAKHCNLVGGPIALWTPRRFERMRMPLRMVSRKDKSPKCGERKFHKGMHSSEPYVRHSQNKHRPVQSNKLANSTRVIVPMSYYSTERPPASTRR